MPFLFKKRPGDRRRRSRDTVPPRRRGELVATHEAPEQTFRRNRTITGSTSRHVSATTGSGHNLSSERTKAHELTKRRKKVMSILGFVLLLAVFVGILISQYTGSVSITSASTAISKELRQDVYAASVEAYLRAHPLERFRFATNMDRLALTIEQEHPEVSRVSQAGMERFGVSRFAFEVRTPVASWSIGDTRYYTDDGGATFQVNYYNEPSIRVVDNSGATVPGGSAIIGTRLLEFVGRVVALSDDAGISIDEVRLPRDTTRQIELKLSGRNTVVRMTIDREAGEQVEDMERALRFSTQRNRSMQQLDVRAPGRAFYRQ